MDGLPNRKEGGRLRLQGGQNRPRETAWKVVEPIGSVALESRKFWRRGRHGQGGHAHVQMEAMARRSALEKTLRA